MSGGFRARTVIATAVLAAGVSAGGCGLSQHAAESAVIGVQSDYARFRVRADQLAPAEARVVEQELEAAKQRLDRGEFREALAAARSVDARVRALGVRLPAIEDSLATEWARLESEVPARLDSLVRGAPPRPSAAALARTRELGRAWEDAQDAHRDGRWADAVREAAEIREAARAR